MNIQELWTKAGGHYDAGNQHTYPQYTIDDPEKFAALVAAHEREACAKVCESIEWSDEGKYFAKQIRARGPV